jgi:hypothetical protein
VVCILYAANANITKEGNEPNGKIIVSMTTIPDRITMKTIAKTLNSISLQTVKPDVIYINIPRKTKNGMEYPIDDLYKIANDYENVKIN